MSCCNHCIGADRLFDRKTAIRERKRYGRKGPKKSTRLLLEALLEKGVQGKTLLDIGGGIGEISFELLKDGLAGSTHVDASSGYLEVSSKEAAERGLTDRIDYHFGDFTDLASGIDPADIVTLDRVVCCYPDLAKLIGASAGKATGYVGLVYPRARRSVRLVSNIGNIWFRIRKLAFRSYVHPPEEIDRLLREEGFSQVFKSRTLIWETVLYERTKLAATERNS